MSETLTDLFCGAGGSGQGARYVPGVELAMAANHWRRAIDTHQANFPTVDHDCADISQVDPRRYPRTSILWASPECTNHSGAKGRKRRQATPGQGGLFTDPAVDPGAVRSRATMWDVPRFAEHHRYRAVIVENVVEAARWEMFPAWLHAMDCLGYRHRIVWANSMHFPAMRAPRAPQSRDRIYVVFWRRGQVAPELDLRPGAVCPTCGPVAARQVFKRGDRTQWGRYRTQYLYRCPNPGCRFSVVEPAVVPASSVIDWTVRGQRIGDRAEPLAANTLDRIRVGLARYATAHLPAGPVPLLVPDEGRSGKYATPVTAPIRTQTTRNETALLVPAGGTWNDSAVPVSAPLRARTTSEAEALVVPYYGTGVAHPTGVPLGVLSTRDRFGVAFIAELRGGGSTARPVAAPLATVTASGNHHGLVQTRRSTRHDGPGQGPRVEDCTFRMLEPREIAAAMAFTPDYRVLGSKRDQVRQLGNAVTPPAAEFLLRAVAASLNGDGS